MGATRNALHVVLHELGHYADCFNNGNSFDNEQDGCGAEQASRIPGTLSAHGCSVGRSRADLLKPGGAGKFCFHQRPPL